MREALRPLPEPQEHPRITFIAELRAALDEYTKHPPVAPANLVREICDEMRIVIGLQENIAMAANAESREKLLQEYEIRMRTLHNLEQRLITWQRDPFNG